VPHSPALRDQVRRAILDTAANVLAEQGPAASLAEIADAAGVARSTLYRYFPSRDVLLAALAEAGLAELRARLAEAQLDHPSVTTAIARITRGFLATGHKYAALVQAGHKPQAAAEQAAVALGGPLLELFRRGIRDGTLRDDVPPEVLMELFTSLIDGAIAGSVRQRGVEPASSAVLAVFLGGALSQDARS
jgi:TetR/AcrR family transcriptional repressor of mexCD-oprJ operon